MLEPRSNADDFFARGAALTRAFEILQAGCDVPPSRDVFLHELARMRKGLDPDGVNIGADPGLSPESAARSIVDGYSRRIEF